MWGVSTVLFLLFKQQIQSLINVPCDVSLKQSLSRCVAGTHNDGIKTVFWVEIADY